METIRRYKEVICDNCMFPSMVDPLHEDWDCTHCHQTNKNRWFHSSWQTRCSKCNTENTLPNNTLTFDCEVCGHTNDVTDYSLLLIQEETNSNFPSIITVLLLTVISIIFCGVFLFNYIIVGPQNELNKSNEKHQTYESHFGNAPQYYKEGNFDGNR